MNLTSYQNLIDKVGLANLNEANRDTYNIVKEGSENFSNESLWKQMLEDSDIRDAYEMHVKQLEKMTDSEPKAIMKVEKKVKSKKPKSVAKKKAPELKKLDPPEPIKKVVVKRSVKKRVKSAPKRAKKAVKRTVKKEAVKFPITVKRFGKEIQLIRRTINLDGKRKGVNSLQLLHRDVKKTIALKPDRKSVLSEISKRIGGAVKKANEAGVKELDVKLDKDFLDKLKKSNNPKPKMKVEFLSGPPKKKAKKKKAARKKSSRKKKLNSGMNGVPEIQDYVMPVQETDEYMPYLGFPQQQPVVPRTAPSRKAGKSVSELTNGKFDMLNLDGPFLELIGEACKPTHIFIFGPGGSGKSTLTLLLSNYLAGRGQNVLYVASESYGTPVFSKLLKRLRDEGRLHDYPNFIIAQSFDGFDLNEFDVVAIDSKDAMGMDLAEYKDMFFSHGGKKAKYPKLSTIVLSEATKDNKFTGSERWRNTVDTMIYCENMVAYTNRDKNRWGAKAAIPILEQQEEPQPEY